MYSINVSIRFSTKPAKLEIDLLIHINIQSVTDLFTDCDSQYLRDLSFRKKTSSKKKISISLFL